jgi:hypothetical protein
MSIVYSTQPMNSIVDVCFYQHLNPVDIKVKDICKYAIENESTQLEIIEMCSYMYGMFEDILAHSNNSVEKYNSTIMMNEFDAVFDFIEKPNFHKYIYELADEPLPIINAMVSQTVDADEESIPVSPITYARIIPQDNDSIEDDSYSKLEGWTSTTYTNLCVNTGTNTHDPFLTPTSSPRCEADGPPLLPIRPGFLSTEDDDLDSNEVCFSYEYEIDHFVPAEYYDEHIERETPETVIFRLGDCE